MMTIKMLRNERGSEDGFTVKYYEQGESYDVAAGLGTSFVRSGAAERTGGDELEADPAAHGVQPAAPIQPNGETKPVYEGGNVYEVEGNLYLAVEGVQDKDGKDLGEGLMPLAEVPQQVVADLVREGKLTPEGKLPGLKSQESAPQNKAVKGAPQNKGR